MANILTAIKTIIDNPISDLVSYYKGKNKINQVGDALECFIKDIFADTVTETDPQKKLIRYSEVFSYSGNANNPPDLMLKNGDAVEVKKIESLNAMIALNSSYPKSKLYYDSPLITKYCRDCEDWQEKDIIYAIGVTQDKKLKLLWLIYGDCYFASKEIYEKLIIATDPLKVTVFKFSLKCQVNFPSNVFNYLDDFRTIYKFNLYCLITKSKYYSFPTPDVQNLEILSSSTNLKIRDVEIKSPNNPIELIPTKLISFGHD